MERSPEPGRQQRGAGRLTWRKATLVEARQETATARTLVFDVPDWPGHLAGQHVDVRLTAPDGYTAQRSYSIASATGVEITVQRLDDGEVSPYLTDVFDIAQLIELRGPIGGWFVWRPSDPAPVQLIAGGSGVVPLMAMIRARAASGAKTPFKLLYSARTPEDVIYADELRRRARDDGGLDVQYIHTRVRGRRVGVADVHTHAWPKEFEPSIYVCGPTGFVETVADILVALGHDARKIKTERYG
ncbi:ferredoxin reductase [Dactylosporangium matsuzakiense]|uniref:Oxidoreductase n=1 Tax=Dactylosporangium matsuzakiense TaxID=53360 RepID=A0A9W6KMI6_9ACTN|nr:ferredoxin reductase [Dactylosporangium matsuzakiense]UWZ43494.1 ferredoxin reductase [Dactylosporangium matsuzakiense]GLL02991.1 oxidoreductase [Dactylosporangium matsuzakiense]